MEGKHQALFGVEIRGLGDKVNLVLLLAGDSIKTAPGGHVVLTGVYAEWDLQLLASAMN